MFCAIFNFQTRSNLHDADKYKGIPIEQFLEEINDEKA